MRGSVCRSCAFCVPAVSKSCKSHAVHCVRLSMDLRRPIPAKAYSGGPILGHITYLPFDPLFGPGFPFFSTRLSILSTRSTNASSPIGRPDVACRRIRINSSFLIPTCKNPFHSSPLMPNAFPLTRESCRPFTCAAALDHGHCSAYLTSPARTGLSSMYLSTAIAPRSSSGHEENRPCQR